MSSLLDHLDNNYSDGDEDDHINRLFPKCKPRASSLQPFASNSTNESSLSSESRTSLSDCNLTNTNDTNNQKKNINNTVNNNLFIEGNRLSVAGLHPSDSGVSLSTVTRNGHVSQSDNDNNVSLRCLSNGPPLKVSSSENSNKVLGRSVYPPSSSVPSVKAKGKSERSSRSRRNHHHHHHQQHHPSSGLDFVPGKTPALHSTISGQNPVNPSVVVNNKRNNSSSTSHGRIMECDTLDDHFDNGIGSGGSSGSNGSAFSQSSSLSSTGEKTNVLSVSSSGLGSSGGNVGLRDSRIEIAGGREIFSQNRIKAGRRVRGSTSMDSMIVPQNMESSGPHHGLTPSSSQSQLQGKGRRKVTHNAPNPLISPSSPVNASSIWEPHLVASSVSNSKRNFPFSSSSSSSSRGGGDRERDRERIYANSGTNPLNRHSGGSGHGGNSYLRSNRSSQYYPHHHDYPLTNDTKKSPSLEGMDKTMLPQVHSPTNTAKSPPGGLVMKETVFASEITSIEKPVEVGKEAGAKPAPAPFVYETPIDGGGEIVFDDIEDHWRDDGGKAGDKEATFVSMGSVDKSQLNFLETLMRDNEEQQQQQHKPQLHLQLQQKQQQHSLHSSSKGMSNVSITHGSSPSNPSGYDSDECASSSVLASNNNVKTSPNNGNKRLIGNIPIAEYEGSPKRYGLRQPTQAKPNHLELVDPNSPTIAHLSMSASLSPRLQSPSSSSFASGGARLPGFPLRVDTSTATGPPPTIIPSAPCSSSNSTNSGKTLVNESSCEPSNATGTGMGILMESNDHNSDLDGQLSSKLDGGTFTTTGNFSSVANIMTTPNAAVSPTCSVNSAALGMAGIVGSSMVTKTTGGTSTDIASDDSVASQQGSNLTTANSLEDTETEVSGSHRLDVTDSHEDDYLLYEFSETRKVLEEFFKPVPGVAGGGGGGGERLSNFDELDYTLKRQAGNSYVGQRLASESSNERNVEESPKKPPRRSVQLNISSGGGASPKLISFQEVSLPLSHNSHSQSSISPSSMAAPTSAAMLLDSSRDVNDNDIDVETASTNTETDLGDTEVGLQVGHSRNFTLSPETTDCDSNELESEISLDFEASIHSSSRIGATMPVLEDGLSSGNVSDNEDRDEDDVVVDRKRNAIINRKINNGKNSSSAATASGIPPQQVNSGVSTEPNPTLLLMKKQISEIEKEIKLRSQRVVSHSESNGTNGSNMGPSSTNGPGPSPLRIPDSSNPGAVILPASSSSLDKQQIDMNSGEDSFPLKDVIRSESNIFDCNDPELEALDPMRPTPPPSPAPSSIPHHLQQPLHHLNSGQSSSQGGIPLPGRMVNFTSRSPNEGMNNMCSNPVPSSHTTTPVSSSNNTHPESSNGSVPTSSTSASATFMVAAGTSTALNSSLGLLHESANNAMLSEDSVSPGGADIQSIQDAVQLASKNLPSQRSSTFDASSTGSTSGATNISMTAGSSSSSQQPPQHSSSSEERLVPLVRDSSPVWVPRHPASTSGNHHPHRSVNAGVRDPLLRKQRYEETPDDDADTDQETDRLLGQNRTEDDYGFYDEKEKDGVKKKRSKEDFMNNPSVLIEGVLFRARYLGSTQLVCEGQPTKATRMMQAEEAVSRIKAQANQNGSVCQLSSSPPTSIEPPSCEALSPYRVKSDGNYSDFVYKNQLSRRRSTGGGIGGDGDGGSRDEDDDEGESDEDSVDEDDYFREQRNPVAAALGDSILVDNNVAALTMSQSSPANSAASGGGCGGRRLSSSDLTSGGLPPFSPTLPGSNGSSVGGSLPHLSPPCGSALPGTMFRLRFVGSLEVEEEVGSGRRRRKRPKKTMVEEAVLKLKAPEGETQPSTEVDLFISTEKIMVLNTDLKEIMMDHALRTISYIADIGDLVVLMARRRPVPTDTTDESKIPRPPKMICHVFESDEAQYIAQSIGQAFQVAYMEFLKANGIEDHSFVREMDYQEVLNSQEIFGDELQMFAKKELQKEVVVPKTKGEILGVVIVESGWGSMLPTVVIANLAPAGAAARCGQLNIGDQIIAINGVSLVGLPLSTCQNYIKNTKTQTVVKLTVVPCPPVVEVKIKRPDTKYQLGFSVQNGVICSLLRGGIAERGGVRVGHRIIEINNQSVVAVPHEKIVNLLATSVGEINMKTMPTSMFRLLTGQETPLYI